MGIRLVEFHVAEYGIPDPTVFAWNLYLSRWKEAKGVLVHRLFRPERHAVLQVEEGEWWIRALPAAVNGIEGDWQAVEPTPVLVAETVATVVAPANPGVNVIRPETGLRISIDPPAANSDDHYLEVLQGPDGDRGKLLGVIPVTAFRDPTDRDMLPRLAAGPPVAIDGAGLSTGRPVVIRPVGRGGNVGPEVLRTVVMPHRPDAVPLLLFSLDGDSPNGFETIDTEGPLELDATDGLRLKAIPIWDADEEGWDIWDEGAPDEVVYGTEFRRNGTYASVVHDFGAPVEFQLSIYDEFQRKSGTAAGPDTWDLDDFEWDPAALRGPERFVVDDCFWRNAQLTWDDKPLRPLPAPRWEYRLDETGPWLPHDPEAVLVAQQVEVRALPAEPTGFFQLICPKIRVHAILKRYRQQGSGGVYTGGAGTVTVNLANHPVTGSSPWPHEMVVTIQPHAVSIAHAVTQRNNLANPPNFVVQFIDLATGLAPAGNVGFSYVVSGH